MDSRLQEKIDRKEATEVNFPAVVSVNGLTNIRQYILNDLSARFSEVNQYDQWQSHGRHSVDFDAIFEGNEMVNNRGKIVKRIKRNVRRLHGISLADNFLSELGNMAQNYSVGEGDYIIELSDDILGNLGNFQDDDSCFREGEENYHHSLAMDGSGDYQIMLVYSLDGRHLGRTLVSNELAGNRPIIFNSYGLRLNQCADMLAKALGEDTREIRLHGDIWINSSYGYIFGDTSDERHYNLAINPMSYVPHCIECNYAIRNDLHQDDNGNQYCESCYYDRFKHCEECGEYHDSQEVDFQNVQTYDYYNRRTTKTLCEFCCEDEVTDCPECEHSWTIKHMIMNESSGEFLCENCLTKMARIHGSIRFDSCDDSDCHHCEQSNDSADEIIQPSLFQEVTI